MIAAQFNMEMSRSLQGIGATLQSKNEYVTIESIVAGGPADKSHQINTGDRILAVAQGKDGEFQDIIGWRLDNAIKLIRGTKGTVVKLKILPQGKTISDQPKILELVREKIVLKDALVKQEIKTYNNNGKTYKIGIINVPAFYADFAAYRAGDPNYQSTTRDMKLALDTLKRANVDGVIVDLRENGGGSLNEAISTTGLFIKTGPVVQVRDSQEQIDVNKDEDPSIAYAGPMAVLVDRFSASASEIFAGAIQDYGRGLIIGTQTYGKGTVQNEIDLDKVITPSFAEKLGLTASSGKKPVSTGSENNFGQLNLTIAKFYRISGNSTQHKGVIPDIQFPSLIPLDKYGEDTDPSALPFDVIPKSDYVKAGDLSAAIPQLNKMHEQRVSTSASYKAFTQTIADYRKSEKEKSVSLNEEQLKKQRTDDEQKTLNRDNDLRVALGFKPLKKAEAKPKKEDLDPLKLEAGQILVDYINLDSKVTRVGTVIKK
jgi:carboxyl-terminal processing protease